MATMIVLVSILVLLCLDMAAVSAFQSQATRFQRTSLNMCKVSESTQQMNKIQRKIKAAIAAVVISTSAIDTSFALPDAPVPMTRSVLEQSVQRLEKANSKTEVSTSLGELIYIYTYIYMYIYIYMFTYIYKYMYVYI
jgi:hypothetical protein